MNPKLVKGWACSFCNKIYFHNENGKIHAQACCKCEKCDNQATDYTGLNQKCRKCFLEEFLPRMKESTDNSVKKFNDLKDEFEKLTGVKYHAQIN